jgi:hypothetical protein
MLTPFGERTIPPDSPPMVCRVSPDWDLRVVPPTCDRRCSIGTTMQVPFKTPWRSRQFVHSTTSIDVKMEKESFSGVNVHIHHSVCHRSVEQETARTTSLHCMPSSFLSQALEPSRDQHRGRYGEEPARGAIDQYCPDRESFAEISRADEGLVIHAGRYGAAPVTCQRSRTSIL